MSTTITTSTRTPCPPATKVLVRKRLNALTTEDARKSGRVQHHGKGTEITWGDVSGRRNVRSLVNPPTKPVSPTSQPRKSSTLVFSKARSPASTLPPTRTLRLPTIEQSALPNSTQKPAARPAMHAMTRSSSEDRPRRPVQRPPLGKPPLLLQPRLSNTTTSTKNLHVTTNKPRTLRRVTGDVSSVKNAAQTGAAPVKAVRRDALAEAKKTILVMKVGKTSVPSNNKVRFPTKTMEEGSTRVALQLDEVIVKGKMEKAVPAAIEIAVRVNQQEKSEEIVRNECTSAPIPAASDPAVVADCSSPTPDAPVVGGPTHDSQAAVPLDFLGELRLALAKRGMLKTVEPPAPAPTLEPAEDSPARKLIDKINKLKSQKALGDITNLTNPTTQESIQKARALIQSSPVLRQHSNAPTLRPAESSLDAHTWNVLAKAGVKMQLVATQTRTPAYIRQPKIPALRACDFPSHDDRIEREVEGLRYMKLIGLRSQFLTSTRAFGGGGPANVEEPEDSRKPVISLLAKCTLERTKQDSGFI